MVNLSQQVRVAPWQISKYGGFKWRRARLRGTIGRGRESQGKQAWCGRVNDRFFVTEDEGSKGSPRTRQWDL